MQNISTMFNIIIFLTVLMKYTVCAPFKNVTQPLFDTTAMISAGNSAWGYGSHFHELHSSHYMEVGKTGRKNSFHPPATPLTDAFYHVYALGEYYPEIVNDQLTTLNQSGLYEVLDTVFYNTVTNHGNLNNTLSLNAPKFHHLYDFENGNEVNTLGMMYRFCQAYPRASVLYFHDKGSYHYCSENVLFRKLLDCHVLNPQCVHALHTNKYDTCGMRISPIPHPHYSGNYFWSTCQYMTTQLFDPWISVTNESFVATNKENFTVSCAGTVGRLFAETWIGSGVNIRPADCVSAKVDDSYLHGYDFPDAFQDICPNTDRYKRLHAHSQNSNSSIKFGTGVCQSSPSWYNLTLFQNSFLRETKRLVRRCKLKLSELMEKRSLWWYGQPFYSYTKNVTPFFSL